MSHQHHAEHMHAGHVDVTTATAPAASAHVHSKLDHANMDMGMMDMGMDHMMMFFHLGCEETILFETWKISTVGGLIGSMIGIFIMAALYEGLKYYREYLFWKTYSDMQYRAVSMPHGEKMSEERQMGMVGEVIHKRTRPTMLSLPHVFQTGMHIVQIVLSYFLMLIFMTYNVWLCIAVVAGAATGYFLFGWKKTVIMDVTEHCH